MKNLSVNPMSSNFCHMINSSASQYPSVGLEVDMKTVSDGKPRSETESEDVQDLLALWMTWQLAHYNAPQRVDS
ncbi:hypothetical protein SRHO_G00094530 [Serrasalmus rhombeus]